MDIPNIGVLAVDASCMINGTFKDIDDSGDKHCCFTLSRSSEKKFPENYIEEVEWHSGDRDYSERYARYLDAEVLDDDSEFIYFEEEMCNFFSYISQSLADDRRIAYRDFSGLFVRASFKDGQVIFECNIDLGKDVTSIDQLLSIISDFQKDR